MRDLEATRRFYRDLLGLRETGTAKNGRIVFFSAGVHHHDVSCELARAASPGTPPKGVPGFYHVAFCVGTTDAELAGARRDVVTHGLEPFGEGPAYFCVRDPDGHEVELYVDHDADGAARTRQMANAPAASPPTAKPNAGR